MLSLISENSYPRLFSGAGVNTIGQDSTFFVEDTKHKLVFQYLKNQHIRHTTDLSQDITYKTSSQHDIPDLPRCKNQAEKNVLNKPIM